MTFPFNHYATALLSSLILVWALLPFWIGRCVAWNLTDDPGHRKIHREAMPLAGGIALLVGLLIPIALGVLFIRFADPSGPGTSLDLLRYGFSRRVFQLMVIVFGAAAMVILGLLDDKYELSPFAKFGGQLIIACFVAASGIRITLFVPSLVFSYFITIFWVLTITNAMNFLDNMNGLSSGVGCIAAWGFAWSAALHGQYLVSIIAFATCGGLLGFLPYNFPKARTFLGDSGSHLVGFLLSILAIMPHFYSGGPEKNWVVLAPLLILAVPLIDLSWVVLYRTSHGKPFFIGDTNHLSHKLVKAGLSHSLATLILWLGAAMSAWAAVFVVGHGK